jgi:hypothetical protein
MLATRIHEHRIGDCREVISHERLFKLPSLGIKMQDNLFAIIHLESGRKGSPFSLAKYSLAFCVKIENRATQAFA